MKRLDLAKDIVFDVGNARSLMMYPDYFHAVFTAVLVVSSQSDMVLISVALTDLSTVWSYLMLLHSQGEYGCCGGNGGNSSDSCSGGLEACFRCKRGMRVESCSDDQHLRKGEAAVLVAGGKSECPQLRRPTLELAMVSPHHERRQHGAAAVNAKRAALTEGAPDKAPEARRPARGSFSRSSVVPLDLIVSMGHSDGHGSIDSSRTTTASTASASDVDSDDDGDGGGGGSDHEGCQQQHGTSCTAEAASKPTKSSNKGLIGQRSNRREVSAFGHIKSGHFRLRKILFNCQQLVSIQYPNMTAPIQCGVLVAVIMLCNYQAYHFDNDELGRGDFASIARCAALLLSAELSFFMVRFF
jgi:hypothetical protein